MVIGDSFLHGVGVPDSARFAVRLEELLDAMARERGARARVLDLTVAGYNTTKNAEMFHRHVAAFAPHAVIWGYYINDVYGVQPAGTGSGAVAGSRDTEGRPVREHALTPLWRIQGLAFRSSRLLRYVVSTVSRELKLRGLVIPGTVFHHELTRSHAPDFAFWRNSQATLGGVWATCRANDILVLLLNCPVLKMISHYTLFDDVDARIAAYAAASGIDYLRGIDCFPDRRDRVYAISRYDPHPNEIGHELLARCVAEALMAQGLAAAARGTRGG
jgi:hypothetical protein